MHDARVFSCEARVYAMHVNPRKEHDVGYDDDSCRSYCSTRVSILVEDMESGVNTLHGFGALFLWDAWRLGKYC